ncbi:MAG TPA: hypothetical protein VFW65_15480 [Pseudonocardiaceae bacterium]|nr:hypothetical protein [Pseudonocardiaceae bacterium]
MTWRRLPGLAWRGLPRLAWRGLPRLAWRGLPRSAWRSLPALAWRGLVLVVVWRFGRSQAGQPCGNHGTARLDENRHRQCDGRDRHPRHGGTTAGRPIAAAPGRWAPTSGRRSRAMICGITTPPLPSGA